MNFYLNQYDLRMAYLPLIKAVMDSRASESKFKAHFHDGVVCPSCLRTARNSVYLVRAAAVCTTSKKQKTLIQNAARLTHL